MPRSGINYESYDANFKIAICQEYLKLSAKGLISSKRKFAISKEIKPTTFYDWINAYLKYQADSSNDGVINTSNNEESLLPKFVKISEESTMSTIPIDKDNKVILRYKDISLEFNESSIDKALEIIKRW